jgi:S1-C subfamily serine protease
VGINTGIFSESGGYQGIGFAVPSKIARHVVDELMAYGAVRRGSIGYVNVEKLTPDVAQEMGLKGTNGALVVSIARTSEAHLAGIDPGDIVVAFNGQVVTDPSDLLRFVDDAKIGSTATVMVVRQGRKLEIKVPVVSSARRQ